MPFRFRGAFSLTGLPAWVTASPAYQNGAAMVTDWTQANDDGTYGQTYLRATNSVVKASTVWSRAGTGGTAIDASGNVVTFSGTALRATSAGLTTEEARTNLFLNSGAPATQTITVTNGTSYTVSCRGSGSITLSGAGTGTASQGSPRTVTASGTSLTVTVSGTVTWPQVEAGAFATTPIPTSGSAVTRVQDFVSASNVSWLSQGAGTLMAAFTPQALSSSNAFLMEIDDGSISNEIAMFYTPAGVFAQVTNVGGTSTGGGPSIASAYNAGVSTKAAYAFSAAGKFLDANGGAVASSATAVTVPSVSAAHLGVRANATFAASGTLTQVAFFPAALTNAQLQAVTQ